MGEWKAQISVRVPHQFRRELQSMAEREHRNLSNLTSLMLEWAFEQLKAAGSLKECSAFGFGGQDSEWASGKWGATFASYLRALPPLNSSRSERGGRSVICVESCWSGASPGYLKQVRPSGY